MRVRSTGLGVVAVVGVGFLSLACSQEARAQVKLEYKYPEGRRDFSLISTSFS
jgi:hypothetical protein